MFCFWGMVLLYSPSWPRTCNPPASADWELGLQDMCPHTWLLMHFYIFPFPPQISVCLLQVLFLKFWSPQWHRMFLIVALNKATSIMLPFMGTADKCLPYFRAWGTIAAAMHSVLNPSHGAQAERTSPYLLGSASVLTAWNVCIEENKVFLLEFGYFHFQIIWCCVLRILFQELKKK
jgi:hypothetical protein